MAQTPRHRGGLTAAVVQTRKEIRRLPRFWHQLQRKNADHQYAKKRGRKMHRGDLTVAAVQARRAGGLCRPRLLVYIRLSVFLRLIQHKKKEFHKR